MLFKRRTFLTTEEQSLVETAIAEAEAGTSGEIRLVIRPGRIGDPMEAAAEEFLSLGMERTRHRNAVLLFLAPDSRAFAIQADKAIYESCGQTFWDTIAHALTEAFRNGQFTQGLCAAVRTTGEQLRKHFPGEPGNINELPDTVIH